MNPNLPKSSPEAQGVSSRAVAALVDAFSELHYMNSFMLLRHGYEIAAGWWKPYRPETEHLLYSLSKSFTSCAIGIARGEGLLDLDDPVIGFFPKERLPEKIDARLRKLTIRHLLTMSAGHEICSVRYFSKKPGADWVHDFFASPVVYEPGTHFVYNSGGTYMLSSIIRQLTGQNLTEYLWPRLLEPLGFAPHRWEKCPQGTDFGGWGFAATTAELARFGQLLLQHGSYNGRQLVPRDYIEEATRFQIDNSTNANPDWKVGYGFQFWRCRHQAFRGDGAMGQYVVVMPEYDAVLATTSGLGGMQDILDRVWEILLPAFEEKPLAPDPEGEKLLAGRIARLEIPSLYGPGRMFSGTYYFETRFGGLDGLTVSSDGKECSLTLQMENGTEELIRAGFAAPIEGEAQLDLPLSHVYSATAAWRGAKELRVRAVFYGTPFIIEFAVLFQPDGSIRFQDNRNSRFGTPAAPERIGRRKQERLKKTIYPFAPNRVLRLYRGGSGIDRLCGKSPAEDTRFPENWIASVIEGNGRAYHSPGHGISKILIDGKEVDFPGFLKAHADAMLGEKHTAKYGPVPGVLVKFLDSAEQLPLQVHPTKEDAKKFLHSDYGKTEAWIVLGTRKINGEEPYLLVGFNDKLDRQIFTRECLNGKFVQGEAMLNKLVVSPGDVIIIRGGLPHAIGPGVTMVEIMEPSDWVIVPEINCCGAELNEKQRFMGIDPETAVNMTDFTPHTFAGIREKYSPKRKVLEKQNSSTLTSLISPEDCELFSACELAVDGGFRLRNPDSFAIGAVIEGNLDFGGVNLTPGGSFFLPYAVKELEISGKGKVILIYPPQSK